MSIQAINEWVETMQKIGQLLLYIFALIILAMIIVYVVYWAVDFMIFLIKERHKEWRNRRND